MFLLFPVISVISSLDDNLIFSVDASFTLLIITFAHLSRTNCIWMSSEKILTVFTSDSIPLFDRAYRGHPYKGDDSL